MTKHRLTTAVFATAAVYDAILGIVFIAAGPKLFNTLNIPPPNHWAYIHFPAALLIVFAIMFTQIALNPENNRALIPYAILMKLAYTATVAMHHLTTALADAWLILAAADAAFLIAFALAYLALLKQRGS